MVILHLEGTCAKTAAAYLAGRLAEYDRVAVQSDSEVRFNSVATEAVELSFEIDVNDSPEFAAEKILDTLAEKDLIRFQDARISPEDEARIRDRLKRLGYIE